MKRFFIFFYTLIGIVFLLAGSLLIWSGLPRTRSVVCRRAENKTIECRIKSAIAGFTDREANLKGLRTVETYSVTVAGEDGDFASFGVYLNFENVIESLDNLTETGAQEIKTKFENFINSPQLDFVNIENSRRDWLQILSGAAAILFVSLMTVSELKRSRKIDLSPDENRTIAANPRA